MRPNAIDAHGDFYTPELTKQVARDFLADLASKNYGIQHTNFIGAQDPRAPIALVESAIETHELVKHNVNVYPGDWTVMLRVNSDELWEAIEKGGFTGISVGGTASFQEHDPTEVEIAKAADTRRPNGKIRQIVNFNMEEFSVVDSAANEVYFQIAKKKGNSMNENTEKEDVAKSDNDASAEKPQDAPSAAEGQSEGVGSGEGVEKAQEASQEPSGDTSEPPAPVAKTERPGEVQTNPDPPTDPIAKTEQASKAKRFTTGRRTALKEVREEMARAMSRVDKLLEEIDNDTAGPEASEEPISKAVAERDEQIADLKKRLDQRDETLKTHAEALESLQKELEEIRTAKIPSGSADGTLAKRAPSSVFGNLIRS